MDIRDWLPPPPSEGPPLPRGLLKPSPRFPVQAERTGSGLYVPSIVPQTPKLETQLQEILRQKQVEVVAERLTVALKDTLSQWTQPSSGAGIADSGTTTSLRDNKKNWLTSQWVGLSVKVLKLNGQEYFSTVTANDDTSITFSPAILQPVEQGDCYAIVLTNPLSMQRWGRNISLAWVHGAAQTAPGALSTLVTKTVTARKTGYVYGFLISAQEANDFLIGWTSGATAYSIRVVSGSGTTQDVEVLALNEGLAADAASAVTIKNVSAGNVGKVYQARLLYGEV